jgi:hypothetical protein
MPLVDRFWSVPLPEGAEPPFAVYVNGEPRTEPTDYVVEGRWLRFSAPLRPKQRLGVGRRVLLSIGSGVYGDLTADVVDVRFHRDGRREVATGLLVIPPPDADPG